MMILFLVYPVMCRTTTYQADNIGKDLRLLATWVATVVNMEEMLVLMYFHFLVLYASYFKEFNPFNVHSSWLEARFSRLGKVSSKLDIEMWHLCLLRVVSDRTVTGTRCCYI